jgi:DNA polymerase III epsilon subunit-like protein
MVDFETASVRGTPCQMGAVRYRNGQEIDALESFIFQPEEQFNSFNIALHGITPETVADAPHWPDAREQLLAFASDAPLVAHNAPFDIGVVRDASDLWSLEWPTLRYACTLCLARRVWPGLNSYSLLLLCTALGIATDRRRAHDALNDARLAGAVLQAAISESEADGLDDLLDRVGVIFGDVRPDGWYGCHARALAASTIEPNLDADPDSAFYGKMVAFTGELAMVRREAWQLVAAAGGTPQDGVTKKTDFLVCGYQDVWKLAAGESKSHKLRRAEELHADGQPIEILIERDFFRMFSASDPRAPLQQRNRGDTRAAKRRSRWASALALQGDRRPLDDSP